MHFTYPRGRAAVLRGFNLRIEEGKITSLLGPSGEGKTTVLRLIAGFLKPNRGSILFDGKDVTHLPPEERGLGIVFQNYALFPHMSVYENVAFGLRMRGRPHGVIERRVAEVLDLVGLRGYERRRPRELSGGEQQRLALARALAPGPQVLLLDEPLSAIDAALRGELRREIKRIQREVGVTTLYITHDQSEALFLSDHVAILLDGQVVQEGPPEEVYLKPANLQVARFLEVENLMEGVVVEVGDGWGRVELKGAEGTQLKALPVDGVERGEEVFLAVRPFHIELMAPTAPREGGVNILQMRIRGVEFTGKDYLISMMLGREMVRARVTPLLYENLREYLSEGSITVFFPPDKTLLYRR